jgi:hypothetical protein
MNSSIIAEDLPPHALRLLDIREWADNEKEAFTALLNERHYLKAPDNRRCHLRQAVFYEGALVALLIWSTCARSLAGRDRFIGWDNRTRQKRLGYVVQNNRFVLLPAKRPDNLASRILKLSLKHLVGAWEERYGKRPELAETFVDPEGYKGTCYRAAGWQNLGRTAGFERVSRDFYLDNEHPKMLWVKLLNPNARERLRDPSTLLPGERCGPSVRVPGAMPVSAKQAESLWQALRKVPDPRARRGRQFPLAAMLATAVLALCCGARTVSDIFRFCQDLRPAQRRNLGFRSSSAAPKVVPPPGEGCWRDVLRKVDPKALAQQLNHWQQSQHDALPELLSIDGKVIGNNLATIVSLVDARDGTPVAQAAATGNGKEQILMQELVESLPEGSLEGVYIGGDALYCHRGLVRTVVQEQGGHVLVQLKANQKTTLDQVETRLAQNPPPFCTPPTN